MKERGRGEYTPLTCDGILYLLPRPVYVVFSPILFFILFFIISSWLFKLIKITNKVLKCTISNWIIFFTQLFQIISLPQIIYVLERHQITHVLEQRSNQILLITNDQIARLRTMGETFFKFENHPVAQHTLIPDRSVVSLNSISFEFTAVYC